MEPNPSPFITKVDALKGIPQLTGLEGIFSKVISYALAFSGIVLFIMLIIGGFKIMTASGDPKEAEAAKKTLTSAITGIVLLILSFMILKLIEKLTGVTLTTFSIVGK